MRSFVIDLMFLFLASIPSLSAGLLFGSLLGYGAYQTTKNPNNLALSLGTSAVLGGIMGVRYLNSGKVMPAGILAALRYTFKLFIIICLFKSMGKYSFSKYN